MFKKLLSLFIAINICFLHIHNALAYENFGYKYLYAASEYDSVSIFLPIVIGFIIALVIVSIMQGQLKTVRSERLANNYIKEESMNITYSNDIFLYDRVSKRKLNTQDDD